LIDWSKKKSPLVRKYEDDLRSYADLHNAINHRISPDYIIAEPHIHVVERIEHIDEVLARPKLVGQLVRKRVMSFQATNSF